MRVRLPSWAACRVVIAVAALYALALQAVLGSTLSAGMVGPDVICLSNAAASADGPAKAPPLHKHLTCCTAAHIAPSTVTPVFASALVVWPARRVITVAWRPEIVAAPRAPPGSAPARERLPSSD